jgi:hypothetical protein
VYDFGADWIHEITWQKVITLEPGQGNTTLTGILRP